MTIERATELIALWTLTAIIIVEVRTLLAIRRDDRARLREAVELADSLGLGGGADFIPFHTGSNNDARP